MTLKIGNISIDTIVDGTMKVDGGVLFGHVPKVKWETYFKPDRNNRVPQVVRAVLVRTPESNLLIEAGAGSKRLGDMRTLYGFTRSQLLGRLNKNGLTARNVDIVAFSNTKFDHIGGATKLDRDSVPVPTFRNASYLMQEESLKAAQLPNRRYAGAFHESDYGPLLERDLVKFVKDGDSIIPGVRVKVMDGAAKGNQVFYIEYGCERIMYVGDIIPTRHHLHLDHIQADAEFPNRLLAQKDYLIKQAVEEGWLMVFGGDPQVQAAYLHMRDGNLVVAPKEV